MVLTATSTLRTKSSGSDEYAVTRYDSVYSQRMGLIVHSLAAVRSYDAKGYLATRTRDCKHDSESLLERNKYNKSQTK